MASALRGALGATWDLIKGQKAAILEVVATAELTQVLITYVRTGRWQLDLVPDWMAAALQGPIAEAEKSIGEPLFELLVRAPSGISAAAWESEDLADAKATIQRMVGFATALPFATAQLAQAARAVLGDNAGGGLAEALSKLPEDIGINWALGTVIANTFERAVVGPIDEAINLEHRPARLEWPQLRALAKQKLLTEEELAQRLRLAGFREQDLPLLSQIGRQLLSVGDLQQLYLLGLMTEAEVGDYLDAMDYSPEDRQRLVQLYLERAATQGGDLLRSTARQGFVAGHLSEAQYRALLLQVNVPARSIELDVEAANLQIGWGRLQLTVSEVKQLHATGQLNDRESVLRLEENGYGESDAQALVTSWGLEKRAGRSGLTIGQILGYLVGGVLTQPEAYDRLIQAHVAPEAATLLSEHPERYGGVYRYDLQPATIIRALLDKVLTVEQARAKLLAVGTDPEEAQLELAVAVTTLEKGPKPKAAAKALSEAQVMELMQAELATAGWAVAELVTLGYTEAEAQALIALSYFRANGKPPPGWVTLN